MTRRSLRRLSFDEAHYRLLLSAWSARGGQKRAAQRRLKEYVTGLLKDSALRLATREQ